MTKHVAPKLSMSFQPEAWNGQGTVREANCLAYSLDEPALGWPLLSSLRNTKELSGEKDFSGYRTKIRKNTRISDAIRAKLHFTLAGIEIIRPHTYTPAERHIFAYASGHFYRLDGDNTWSHKNGDMPATNRDSKGHIIENLESSFFCKQTASSDKAAEWIRKEEIISHVRTSPNFSQEKKMEHIYILRLMQRAAARKTVSDVLYLSLPKEGIFVNYVPPPPEPTAVM